MRQRQVRLDGRRGAGITALLATLFGSRITDGGPGPEAAAVATNIPASTGSTFRYDAASGQYLYIWSAKGFTKGTYQLRIDLGHEAEHTVQVNLK